MSISKYLTKKLIEEKIIEHDDEEVYVYCINALLDIVGNIFVTLVFGFLFGRILGTIIFLAIVVPLRSCAGGYHAETSFGCMVLSVLYYMFSVYLPIYIKYVDNNIINFLFVLISVAVAILSPVESVNKPLSSDQEKRMRRFSGCMIFIIVFFYIIFQIRSKKEYAMELFFIILILFISQVVEKEKLNKKHSC